MMSYTRKRQVLITGALAVLMSGSLAGTAMAEGSSSVAEGKSIAFSRTQGNCLACHMIEDGESPGNIAPPLVAMKSRYPDKAKLRAQIWDATKFNPDSPMPPFGKLKILSESEVDKVVDYVMSL
jgi:sulfur-oxidizing protein SoxX